MDSMLKKFPIIYPGLHSDLISNRLKFKFLQINHGTISISCHHCDLKASEHRTNSQISVDDLLISQFIFLKNMFFVDHNNHHNLYAVNHFESLSLFHDVYSYIVYCYCTLLHLDLDHCCKLKPQLPVFCFTKLSLLDSNAKEYANGPMDARCLCFILESKFTRSRGLTLKSKTQQKNLCTCDHPCTVPFAILETPSCHEFAYRKVSQGIPR